MLINDGSKNETVAAGSGQATAGGADTTFTFTSGLDRSRRMVHLYIIRTNSTTTFSWKITDSNSIVVAQEKGIKRDVKIKNPDELPSYLYGSFTVNIFNSSSDEIFTILPVLNEEVG